jgi:Raf kinase inhibitor-like YbhB/YbcL family protein
MAFTLKSTAFAAGGAIPRLYTCDDRDVSPPLEWRDVPAGSAGFALICDDPDAPGGSWVHWVLYGIPGGARRLPEGVAARERLEDGGLQGRNDFGRPGYGGPCPPPGRPHRYVFTLYALDKAVAAGPGLTKRGLLQAMAGHVLARAELVGSYGRR